MGNVGSIVAQNYASLGLCSKEFYHNRGITGDNKKIKITVFELTAYEMQFLIYFNNFVELFLIFVKFVNQVLIDKHNFNFFVKYCLSCSKKTYLFSTVPFDLTFHSKVFAFISCLIAYQESFCMIRVIIDQKGT